MALTGVAGEAAIHDLLTLILAELVAQTAPLTTIAGA